MKLDLTNKSYFLSNNQIIEVGHNEYHWDKVINNSDLFSFKDLDKSKINDPKYIDFIMNTLLKREWITTRIYESLNYLVAFLDITNLSMINLFTNTVLSNKELYLSKPITYIYEKYGMNTVYKFNTIDIMNEKLFKLYDVVVNNQS